MLIRHETPVLAHPIRIIHLDNDLVVLDKPCSLPVSEWVGPPLQTKKPSLFFPRLFAAHIFGGQCVWWFLVYLRSLRLCAMFSLIYSQPSIPFSPVVRSVPLLVLSFPLENVSGHLATCPTDNNKTTKKTEWCNRQSHQVCFFVFATRCADKTVVNVPQLFIGTCVFHCCCCCRPGAARNEERTRRVRGESY